MELLSFEAHFYNANTFGTLPTTNNKCVASPTASVRHRLAAGTLALIQADNLADERSARAVYEAVQPLQPRTDLQRIDYLTIGAIFHSSFGDVTQLPSLLNELVELTRRVRQPAQRAVLLRRAVYGLCRFGPRPLARHVLSEAMEVFERLQLSSQLTHCLEHLSILELQERNYSAVESCLSKLHSISTQSAGFYTKAVEYEIRVQLAFEINSVAFRGLPTGARCPRAVQESDEERPLHRGG
jgi:hypothetical protein